ncbi:TPA: hypothetical protein ACNVML_001062 [Klebsiella pneumoniae]|nr:hypothetical protein [Klebsiella pneumoniae]MEC5528489.1 hypothetical protein [Klebsiella pneumoniae]
MTGRTNPWPGKAQPPPGEMAGMAPIDCPPAQRLPGLGSEDRL